MVEVLAAACGSRRTFSVTTFITNAAGAAPHLPVHALAQPQLQRARRRPLRRRPQLRVDVPQPLPRVAGRRAAYVAVRPLLHASCGTRGEHSVGALEGDAVSQSLQLGGMRYSGEVGEVAPVDVVAWLLQRLSGRASARAGAGMGRKAATCFNWHQFVSKSRPLVFTSSRPTNNMRRSSSRTLHAEPSAAHTTASSHQLKQCATLTCRAGTPRRCCQPRCSRWCPLACAAAKAAAAAALPPARSQRHRGYHRRTRRRLRGIGGQRRRA